MESKPTGFCTVVALLGIISAAAGIAGEATMDMGRFPFFFSVILAGLAIITRIYISGCRCCRNDPKSTPMSKRFSVFSWVGIASYVTAVIHARETATNSAVGPKVNPLSSPPQQYYPPPQYPPRQFSPRQYPPQ